MTVHVIHNGQPRRNIETAGELYQLRKAFQELTAERDYLARELEGAKARLTSLGVEWEPSEVSGAPSVLSIAEVACRHLSLTLNEMLSTRRDQRLAYTRYIVIFLARKLTTLSLPNIGRKLLRDHSTIHYGSQWVADRIGSNGDLREDVLAVAAKVLGRSKAEAASMLGLTGGASC